MVQKHLSILVVGALASFLGNAMAGTAPQSGVNGSFHDITYLGATVGSYNQDDYQRVCIFCHTPHNSQTNTGGIPAPLWNHTISTVNLTPYIWAAPANLPISFNADPLVGPSRLCMSCHDGVTAVDSHGPDAGIGTAQGKNNGATSLISPGRYIDNLSVTHPIGFLYQDALNNRPGEIVDSSNYFIASVPSASAAARVDTHNRSASGIIYGTKKISDVLYGGYLTCASCHDVHNTYNAMNDPSISNPSFTPNYFVWAKETNSALCLSCHVK
ncbi:MAG: cytochrome c3 family protein [Oryzomonas sp.]|uniref:cytochrome c3 family protein n=1 Tax=Oryzomonas sp. TaxID=2855186 RepID=UPI002844B8D1|nr:cytochrome c3 family protein [Oryzomonas sp.]MDR3580635.1 cytochrome c3 family protein [Oryzomonas sp.]